MKKKSLAWTLFLIALICAAPPVAEAVTQRDALVALYASTNGDSWTNNDYWNSDTVPLCNWYGIYCDSTNVTEISLNNNNLDGTIPPEIEYLTNLEVLGLTNNNLKGAIPPEIGKLTNLYNLFLQINQLTGPIPREIGKLTNLQSLKLHDNRLTGNIPASFQNLSENCYVDFSNNCLNGCFENVDHTNFNGGADTQNAACQLPLTPGDINEDNIINIQDAIFVLEIITKAESNTLVNVGADLNCDNITGFDEAIYALQCVAELRQCSK